MSRKMYFLPFAALTIFVAYLGLRAGDLPTETEIINRYAKIYLQNAGEGARATDCAATTYPDTNIRMIIRCSHVSGVETTFFVGPRGETLPPPQGPTT